MSKTMLQHRYEETGEGSAASQVVPMQTGWKAIVAATLGNLFEIYDFVAFGMFAIPISKSFFPNSSEVSALLNTFLVFGAGFLARPLGAYLLGAYADRRGRKKALSLTLSLMGVGTAFIVFCPNFDTIGIAAPIIVTVGRLIQGFSAGGEIGGAVAILVESAPRKKRGYYAAFQQLSQGGGVLLAGIVGYALSQVFSNNDLHNWAWRIAFAIGLLIVPVGLVLRRTVDETLLHAEKQAGKQAFLSFIGTHKLAIVASIGVMIFWTITTYVSNYLSTYSIKQLHLSPSASFIGLIAYGTTMVLICPLCGRLSDRIGRKIPMLIGSTGILMVSCPLFWFLTTYPSVESLVLAQIVIGVLLALYASCASAVMGEIFPTSVRATGVAVSYALGVMIFGGFTPAVVTWLIAYLQDPMAISYYLAGASMVSCVIVLFIKDRRNSELADLV